MPDFSKARDPLDVLDMMSAPARAYTEGVAAGANERAKLRRLGEMLRAALHAPDGQLRDRIRSALAEIGMLEP